VNIERLKTIYAIIDGIPAKNIDLRYLGNRSKLDKSLRICPLGWLMKHPDYEHLFKGASYLDDCYFAIAEYLETSHPLAEALFTSPYDSYLDRRPFFSDSQVTDKKLWQARVKAYLA
jgi:hypothetical protein